MTQTRHLINGNIEEKGFNINNFQILYTNRGGTAMFFLISWSAANDEGLFLDKSAKSSPCQVKCPNQNQGSQLLRADCNSFFAKTQALCPTCLKLKAEKQSGYRSHSLPRYKIQFHPSILQIVLLFSSSECRSTRWWWWPRAWHTEHAAGESFTFFGGSRLKNISGLWGTTPWNNWNLAKNQVNAQNLM